MENAISFRGWIWLGFLALQFGLQPLLARAYVAPSAEKAFATGGAHPPENAPATEHRPSAEDAGDVEGVVVPFDWKAQAEGITTEMRQARADADKAS